MRNLGRIGVRTLADDLFHLPAPSFGSELVGLLFEVERLRADIGTGTTPQVTFLELHNLFDTVMSVVSARIEGNHTTVFQALDSAGSHPTGGLADQLREIHNIIETARFIDSLDPNEPVTHALIREVHHRVVEGLKQEGDPKAGQYRRHDVSITGSAHTPPTWTAVQADMDALLEFANRDLLHQEQMLQVALAHHRFVWIHPFGNGNGRVARLFTYAMLRKTIFTTRGYTALNPTSVFGNDRAAYIAALEGADSLDEAGTTQWATFFVRGIRDDLDRVVKLQNHDHVMGALLKPVFDRMVTDGVIDETTNRVLVTVAHLGVVKAGDLAQVLEGDASQRSRAIRDLVGRGLLRRADQGPRFYQLALSTGPIAARLIRRLDELGFLPKMLSDD